MTHLLSAAFAIEAQGRHTAPSTNPERDLARHAQVGTGTRGLLAWLRGTAPVRMLAARKAERELNRAVARLAETSSHLLADIGIIDTPAIAPDMSVKARFDAVEKELRQVTAAVPVPARPAYRPAIVAPRSAPARTTARGAVSAAQTEAAPAQ